MTADSMVGLISIGIRTQSDRKDVGEKIAEELDNSENLLILSHHPLAGAGFTATTPLWRVVYLELPPLPEERAEQSSDFLHRRPPTLSQVPGCCRNVTGVRMRPSSLTPPPPPHRPHPPAPPRPTPPRPRLANEKSRAGK